MEAHGMPGHLIRRLHQISTQLFIARARSAGFDLTPVQFAALDALKENPGIDQSRVASLIAYDRATIGGVIDRLEGKGLIRRIVSRQDRRAREVWLTQEGEKVFDALLPVVRDIQDGILESLSDAERSNFMALARKAISGSSDSISSG